MRGLQIFKNNEFGDIRVLEINNEPWFVGKDVAEVLGYINSSKALKDHVDEEDKLNNESLSSLGQRGGWIINESGLYSLILSSKLPNAKKFKRWVTSEVLPAIRKHGMYATDDVISKTLENPDFMISILQDLKKEREEKKLLEVKIENDKPLVEFANHVSKSVNSISIGDFAKVVRDENIKMGRNQLFSWLRDNKYLMKGNIPYQKYIENKYFEVMEYSFDTPYGTQVRTKTLITGKGQINIVEKLRKTFI